MERPRWRFNAAYTLTPRLSVGFEWNPVVSEVLPTLNWIIATETPRSPMVSFGTSSDRIFTEEGNRAYYVSFAKGIPDWNIAPYVSVNYSEAEAGWNFPFGLNWALGEQWDFLTMHDGRRTHLLLTYKMPTSNITFMLVQMKNPGISWGWGF